MSVPIANCPDCDVAMEIGCLPEIGDHSVTGWTSFLPGVPTEKWFLGLIKTGGIVVDWKKAIPVTVFRCPDCGLLKAYALPPPAPSSPPSPARAVEDVSSGPEDDRYRLGDA